MEKVVKAGQRVWIKKLGLKITTGFLNMGSLTNLKTNKTLFLLCDCHSEILVIEYDHSLKLADLAIYENFVSMKNKLSLWQKWRYCWYVLWHNKPYSDQIVLNNKQLLDLRNFLSGLDIK